MTDRFDASAGLTRRRLLKAAGSVAAAGAALTLPAPFVSRALADTGPIRIGMVTPKQGPLQEQGEYLARGTQLALEQAGGKVLGRPVDLIWLDDPNPQSAQQNFEKLVAEEKVAAVLSGGGSSSALALSAAALRARIPFISQNAAARELTGKDCNRFTFRIQPAVPVYARASGPMLMEKGKNWYMLTASYAFGQDILKSFTDVLQAGGGKVVGADQVPLGVPDFSSFILKIRQAKPDLVMVGVPASDLSNFLKQWRELGMKGRIPITAPAIGDTDLWSVGPEAATGIFSKTWYHADPDNTPEEKAFAEDFRKKYGTPAADKAWLGWVSMNILLGGITQAETTDATRIVLGLEALKAPDGHSVFRDWDHQMLRHIVMAQVKDKITDRFDMLDVIAHVPAADQLSAVYGTKEEVGCMMGSL